MRTLAVIVFLVLTALPLRAEPLTVFAAASLKNVFDAIGEAFTVETGVEVVFSYAGTSVLARQIEQGAPADVFASAHEDWMSYLVAGGLIDETAVTHLASNRIVLIAPQMMTFDTTPDLSSPDDILAILGPEGRIAVAQTNAVPAGIYAREAMESLGIWDALAPRLAQSDNVRGAVFLVARREAPLGMVYQSDAIAEPRVAAIAAIDPAFHSPITYAAAPVAASAHPDAARFVEFLLTPTAKAVLEENGFIPKRAFTP
ncbi:MAG: molybdate ABC transporter substrate-binding protein [Hyphomicrobiales bacterium]